MDQHGFLFRDACAHALRESRSTAGWHVIDCEYPVESAAGDTRIDILLSLAHTHHLLNAYAVVECKRVDPLRFCWVFGSAESSDRLPALMAVDWDDPLGTRRSAIVEWDWPSNCVPSVSVSDWWLNVARDAKGNDKERTGTSPQPIEEALGQLARGVAGFATQKCYSRTLPVGLESSDRAVLIPVILTTARLYAATYSVGDVDVTSGRLAEQLVSFGSSRGKVDELPWVALNYPLGTRLTPEPLKDSQVALGPERLTCYVVNSTHLTDFFQLAAEKLGDEIRLLEEDNEEDEDATV